MTNQEHLHLVAGSSGRIGFPLVESLLEDGQCVLALDRHQNSLAALLDKYGSAKLLFAEHSFTTSSNLTPILSSAEEYFQRPIHSAIYSIYPRNDRWATTAVDSDFSISAEIDNHLSLPLWFCHQLFTHMSHHGLGSIVLLSSIQGVSAPKFEHYANTEMTSPVTYTAAKHGLAGVVKWYGKKAFNTGVRINAVCPGGIADNQDNAFSQAYRNSCSNIGLLQPSHVVPIIKFLSFNHLSSAITGQCILVDDGWSL